MRDLVWVDSPPLLQAYVLRTARAAHEGVLQRLPDAVVAMRARPADGPAQLATGAFLALPRLARDEDERGGPLRR